MTLASALAIAQPLTSDMARRSISMAFWKPDPPPSDRSDRPAASVASVVPADRWTKMDESAIASAATLRESATARSGAPTDREDMQPGQGDAGSARSVMSSIADCGAAFGGAAAIECGR